MVFVFTSSNGWKIIMGRDKFENEELIRYGLPNWYWFHVNDLSSAHVYLQMPYEDITKIEPLEAKSIPEDVLTDCAQLTKANSIEGNKKATGKVKIVYTPWSNLQKLKSMEIGQIGFFQQKLLHYIEVLERDNTIVNRLNKSREELDTSQIKQWRDKFDTDFKAECKRKKRSAAEEEAKKKEEYKRDAEMKSYDRIFTADAMTTNAEIRNAKNVKPKEKEKEAQEDEEEEYDFM